MNKIKERFENEQEFINSYKNDKITLNSVDALKGLKSIVSFISALISDQSEVAELK